MPNHEVISAFLDNEPFDASELGRALAEPSGRELLVDLLALSAVVREESVDARPVASNNKRPARAWWLVSAAAVALAVAGGFAMGAARGARVAVTPKAAPAPTVVVTNEIGWHESKGGN